MVKKSAFRKIKKSMLIVVEGETELIYFDQLKSEYRLANLSIKPRLSPRKDPENIVKRAIKENQRGDFDFTWCIFDLDTIEQNKEKYRKAIAIAKKKKYYIANSFPCFEIWFLLHFNFSTKYYANYEQLKIDLCKHIDDYCKDQKYLIQKNLYRHLSDKLQQAMENSKKLEEYNEANEIELGTRCEIYKIIENIQELGS
jgi:hypothetical protein